VVVVIVSRVKEYTPAKIRTLGDLIQSTGSTMIGGLWLKATGLQVINTIVAASTAITPKYIIFFVIHNSWFYQKLVQNSNSDMLTCIRVVPCTNRNPIQMIQQLL
jgi:hypothetical protein